LQIYMFAGTLHSSAWVQQQALQLYASFRLQSLPQGWWLVVTPANECVVSFSCIFSYLFYKLVRTFTVHSELRRFSFELKHRIDRI
jgi:hypothetical protein